MFTTTSAAAILALTLVQSPDTTFDVSRGMRLELRNQQGEVVVSTWDRDAVRISSPRGEGRIFSVDRSGSVLRVHPENGRWSDRGNGRRYEWDDDDDDIDIRITVPPYLGISIRGTETDVTVDGVQADISVETVEGSISVTGGNGLIRLHSVEEAITLRNATGSVEVTSADGDIYLSNVTGEVSVEAIDGDMELLDIDSRNVTATSVDGNITYRGAVYDDGRYRLSTHDGDVVLHVPESTNATVNVASYDGDFETSFPIVLKESYRRRFSFTLGTGRAEITLEAFDGDIYLRRE